MEGLTEQGRGLSATALKLFAAAAMLCDHMAWLWVPTDSALGFAMHFLGRFTAPIMCFFVAEGFYHTKSLRDYIVRMFIFALVSHFPYVWYSTGKLSFYEHTSIGASLFLGLCALAVCSSKNIHIIIKLCFLAAALCVSSWSDWPHAAVLWVVFFGLFRDDRVLAGVSCSAVAIIKAFTIINTPHQIFQLGTVVAIALVLLFYNGARGARLKWVFYLFYPLHLALLAWMFYIKGVRF